MPDINNPAMLGLQMPMSQIGLKAWSGVMKLLKKAAAQIALAKTK
jgi:hypothetical protein